MLLALVIIAGTMAAQPGGQMAPATLKLKPLATTTSNAAVSPSTLTFTASNPDTSPTVAASAVVSWKSTASSFGATWNLKVSAPASFNSCSTIPASAVTVSCTAVTGGSNRTCGTSTGLSTTPTQIANGTEPFLTATSYSVKLNFTLQDSWKYIASSSCSLSVTYTITGN